MNTNAPLSEQFRLAAFEARFIPEPNSGCWLWTGMIQDRGYGHFCFRQKTVRAHRASWEMFCGPIPEGQHVLHRCDNRLCVNPDHLFLGSHQDNMQDRNTKGRARGPRGEAAALAKLTADDVVGIRYGGEIGLGTALLADVYGVNKSTIQRIISRKLWTHV